MIILAFLAFFIFTKEAIAVQNPPISLTFGVNVSDRPEETAKKFLPTLMALEEILTKKLNATVKIQFRTFNYQGAINAIQKGLVDFCRLGPSSYIKAKEQNPNIKLLAMEKKKSKTFFSGLIIVRPDSGIKTVQDLKGKRFAFGNKVSTIGHFLSQAFLLKHSITANNLNPKSKHWKKHDNVFNAVLQGKADAGALKESTVKKRNKKLPVEKQLKILASFPNVTKPWVARADLPKKVFNAIKEALLSLNKANNAKALKALKADGFARTNDRRYNFVRDGMEQSINFGTIH